MYKLVITCEHAVNHIPKAYQELFRGQENILQTHLGYDIGTFILTKKLIKAVPCSYHMASVSRLLIELNRSERHPRLFSSISNQLNIETKQLLLQQYYYPYRNEVYNKIKELIKKNYKVLHISIHSFTPELNGEGRNNDIGLLFDSRRRMERRICEKWKTIIKELEEDLYVRYNYPYLGNADGFPSCLRKRFSEKYYLGIELEINQKHFLSSKQQQQKINTIIVKSIQELLKKI